MEASGRRSREAQGLAEGRSVADDVPKPVAAKSGGTGRQPRVDGATVPRPPALREDDRRARSSVRPARSGRCGRSPGAPPALSERNDSTSSIAAPRSIAWRRGDQISGATSRRSPGESSEPARPKMRFGVTVDADQRSALAHDEDRIAGPALLELRGRRRAGPGAAGGSGPVEQLLDGAGDRERERERERMGRCGRGR